MTAPCFYKPSQNGDAFELSVSKSATVGPSSRKFLMGGVNTAIALEAAEKVCERPVVYASSQFLSYALLGDTVDVDVSKFSEGRSVTQANVVNRVGGREILRANVALGSRDNTHDVQFFSMPEVPKPADCDEVVDSNLAEDDLGAHTEKRVCHEDNAAGVGLVWIRITDDFPVTIGKIALIADYLAGAIPRTRGASSLDNQVKVISRTPTDWFLCETRMAAFASGFLHGESRIFAEDGTLIALASQSAALPKEGGGWTQSQARGI